MQIFNEFNCRRLDNRFNVFEGMFQNYWFLGINAVIVSGQIMIVFIGGQAFRVTRLNGVLWAVCLICAAVCMPWAMVLRMIPDHHFAFVFNAIVGCFSIALRPFVKVFRLFGWGFKACIRPVRRFTLWVFSRQFSNHSSDSSVQGPTNSEARDKEGPSSMKQRQQDIPEQHQVPPQTSVPAITITTSP